MNCLRHENYKNENTETKYLNNMQNHNIDKFDQKEMMKKRPTTKSSSYDCLINYIRPHKKQWMTLKLIL